MQDRDGVYRGPIRLSWDGLTPMWKKPIGGGRASFAIADGRAFTIEQREKNEVVAAYDVMTGQELWTNAWPESFSQWMGGGEGPRATPAWADGVVLRAWRPRASCAASMPPPAGRLAHEHPEGRRRRRISGGAWRPRRSSSATR